MGGRSASTRVKDGAGLHISVIDETALVVVHVAVLVDVLEGAGALPGHVLACPALIRAIGG